MRPLAALSPHDVAGLGVLAFDLDDTFFDRDPATHRLVLDPDALRALHALRTAGIDLAVVTGRPAAFVEVAMRTWPVSFGVAENGGARSCFDPNGKLVSLGADGDRASLLGVAEALSERHGVGFADDNDLRRVDVTFDIGEHVRIDEAVVVALARDARAAGLRTFRSSIHLHLTRDAHDKATALVELLRHAGVDATRARRHAAFVGDSENDRAAFSAFALTFGVANVAPRLAGLTVPPAFVAPHERSRGFVAIAEAILAARR